MILKSAVENGVNLRRIGTDRIGISVDQRTRPDIVQAVWRAFGGGNLPYDEGYPEPRLPAELERTSDYLTHPIFHMNRAESEMTRYMRRLADRDLALDRAMIPLGSCTMKLNATAEMLPVSGRNSRSCTLRAGRSGAGLPRTDRRSQPKALRDHRLRRDLDAAELRRAGEYAGLLAICRYHLSRGEGTAPSA